MLTTITVKETLIGFACSHVYHLTCLLDRLTADAPGDEPFAVAEARRLQAQLAADADVESDGYESVSRSVGAKVAHAHVIRAALKGGCPVCSVPGDDGEG